MSDADSPLRQRIAEGRAAVLDQVPFFLDQFGKVESEWKADGTRVTAADRAISEGIIRRLSARFAADQFLSEDIPDPGAPIPLTSRFVWILDPIDGTNNFALGIPECAISVGLFEHGQPVYGIVYDLSRRVLLHGGPGIGVWDGDRPCRVMDGVPHKESLIGFHSPFDKRLVSRASGILQNFKIRGLGSATLHLAYVAAGILDGAVDYNVKIWDLAAAIPLCLAAGGEVRFLNGDRLPLRSFDLNMKRIVYVAGAPAMCERLAALTLGTPATALD